MRQRIGNVKNNDSSPDIARIEHDPKERRTNTGRKSRTGNHDLNHK
jgi:hypothetical protein